MAARFLRRVFAEQSGVTMVLVSVSFVAIMAVTAFVIDLGMVRTARSEARVVVDAAATAGSLDIGEGNGQKGCATALAYVELNLAADFSTANCADLTAACTGSSLPATTSAIDGQWKLTITYPISDAHTLMTSSAIGGIDQSVVYSDGLLCERIGINLERTHDTLFARVLGQNQTVTEVHAVSVTRAATVADTAVNLVILERYECDALTSSGSGNGTGGIWVDVVTNPDGSISPGYATVDSDASDPGCGSQGVIDVNGLNAQVRADGPAGCAQQIGSHVGPGGNLVGWGCGRIQVLAPGTPGCNPPACVSTGTVLPDPTALGRRVTRAPIDHRYNCKASYNFGVGWEIRGCPDTPDPKIDNLIAALGGPGVPAGYQTWTGLGHPCQVAGGPGTVIVATGDLYIDCAVFDIKRTVHLTGGNVIFENDVLINGNGFLSINGEAGGDPLLPGLDEVIVYLRSGHLSKAGQGVFAAHNSTVYMAPTSQVSMNGNNSGTLIWTAPEVGEFAHLALWSDTDLDHKLAGQAFLDLRGVFFTPTATVNYSGNGVQHQVAAQFVSRKLRVTGQGVLVVRPAYDAAVLIPDDVVALIR